MHFISLCLAVYLYSTSSNSLRLILPFYSFFVGALFYCCQSSLFVFLLPVPCDLYSIFEWGSSSAVVERAFISLWSGVANGRIFICPSFRRMSTSRFSFYLCPLIPTHTQYKHSKHFTSDFTNVDNLGKWPLLCLRIPKIVMASLRYHRLRPCFRQGRVIW